MKLYGALFILFMVAVTFVAAVLAFGFPGPVALTVHFARIAIVMAVLVRFGAQLKKISRELALEEPDYIIMSVFGMCLSNEGFSTLNEMGRIFAIDTSVFTSPYSGFMSLILTVSCGLALVPERMGTRKEKIVGFVVGGAYSALLVFVAPQFR